MSPSARAGGRLGEILHGGHFAVTGEIVPPRDADAGAVTGHARELVGSIDAANVTDNPTATAHMSAVAGVRLVAAAGIEPTVQVTCRDRNRLAIEGDLLGAWALGARNLLCLSGDPMHVGDQPDAPGVHDLDVLGVVGLARRLRDEGVTASGVELGVAPRFLIGVADVPLADPYEPARLERKLDAGADLVWTQIAYDVEALAAWADVVRPLGVFERASVLVGVVPPGGASAVRFMQEHLPGVSVPPRVIAALEEAGEDAPDAGIDLAAEIVRGVRAIDGISGVHVMGLGHDDRVRAVVERAALFPRPTGAR